MSCNGIQGISLWSRLGIRFRDIRDSGSDAKLVGCSDTLCSREVQRARLRDGVFSHPLRIVRSFIRVSSSALAALGVSVSPTGRKCYFTVLHRRPGRIRRCLPLLRLMRSARRSKAISTPRSTQRPSHLPHPRSHKPTLTSEIPFTNFPAPAPQAKKQTPFAPSSPPALLNRSTTSLRTRSVNVSQPCFE